MRHNVYYNEQSGLVQGMGGSTAVLHITGNNLANDAFTVVLYITIKMHYRLDGLWYYILQ